jgi:hypothetical protein
MAPFLTAVSSPRQRQILTVMAMVAPSGCVAVMAAPARRGWMAASAAATGVASCVSSVSKTKDAEKFTGSLGLKSQEALLVVDGMVVPFRCEFPAGVAFFLSCLALRRRGEFVAVRRPGVVALPA